MPKPDLQNDITQLTHSEREGELIDSALREMATLFVSEEFAIPPRSNQPLIQTCQLIGKVIQRKFIEPNHSKATNVTDRIYEIAVASNVNYRQVLLTPNWWKQDNGPLLGFIADKHVRPIALMTTKPGRYQEVDLEKGIVQKVKGKNAKTIVPKGVMFYRAFPQKAVLIGKDIVNFCLQGRIKDYWTIFLVSLLIIITTLFLPISNQIIFDEIIPYLDELSFFHIFVGLIIMFAAVSLFTITREFSILRAESYLTHDVEVALWERILILPARFFKRFTTGNLIQRVFSIKEMRRLISGQAIRIAINGALSVIFLFAMLYYSLILTVAGFAIIAIGLVVSTIAFLLGQKLELAYQELRGQINGKVIQMIFGLSKIRTNGAENRIFASWAKDTIQSQKLRLRIGTIRNFVNVTNNTLELLKYLIIFIVVLFLLQSKDSTGQVVTITIGSFLAFNAAFVSFSSGLAEFSINLMEMVGVYPLWQRSKVILHEPIETGAEKVNPGSLKGDIRIEHLRFRYDPLNPLIFSDLSLSVASGEFIAIVGPSGCGKSTLMRLLIGFETPEQGAIYYDGKDLATLDHRALRSQLGSILQNSMIIDGTIHENITVGNLSNENEVMNAVQMAGLDLDLKDFPMSLQTLLTTGGSTLSGGQRQKILLARAFLSRPSIMLWDEATNFLDNQSQDIVMHNLEKLDVTRIVIAHRLNTIRHADRIYVMDRGKIIDTGTYKELSARPGMFADLLKQQG